MKNDQKKKLHDQWASWIIEHYSVLEGEQERRERRGGEECPLVLMLFLFGLPVVLDDLLTPAVSCGGVVNLMHTGQCKHQRERAVDYITLLLTGSLGSSALNTSPIYLSPPWIGRLSHRPGRAPTPPPCPPALFLLAPPSLPPFRLHSPTLLLLFLLLLSSWLWMPSSLTVWTREEKEERAGWRTSGRNGRAFFSPLFLYRHAATWLCVTLWVCSC